MPASAACAAIDAIAHVHLRSGCRDRPRGAIAVPACASKAISCACRSRPAAAPKARAPTRRLWRRPPPASGGGGAPSDARAVRSKPQKPSPACGGGLGGGGVRSLCRHARRKRSRARAGLDLPQRQKPTPPPDAFGVDLPASGGGGAPSDARAVRSKPQKPSPRMRGRVGWGEVRSLCRHARRKRSPARAGLDLPKRQKPAPPPDAFGVDLRPQAGEVVRHPVLARADRNRKSPPPHAGEGWVGAGQDTRSRIRRPCSTSRHACTTHRTHKKKPRQGGVLLQPVAERTGLEPATSGVTGQHSNQLNYRSTLETCCLVGAEGFEPPTLSL